MEIFYANVRIQLVIKIIGIVMLTEPTSACGMYYTKCLFQSSDKKCKLDTCKDEVQNCVH